MAPITHLVPRLPSLSQLESLLGRAVEPSRTLLTPPTLAQRQDGATVTVIATDGDTTTTNSPSDAGTSATTLTGGAIAGIVIGSIAGFLLLVWIFRSCSNLGAPPGAGPNPGGRAWYDGVRDEYPPRHVSPVRHGHSRSRSRSRHSHRGRNHHHHHHHHGAEVQEVAPVAVIRSRSPRAPPAAYGYDGRRGRRERSRGY